MSFSFYGYYSDIRRSSISEKHIEGLKRREKFDEVENLMKILQYITCILRINSSNRMFCSIHDFTFLRTDTKI